MSLGAIWTQFFPPRNGAPLTETNLLSQAGKVFIVTGGSSGIGYETSRILYGAGGKVYMLTRSKDNAEEAITRIKTHYVQDGDVNVKTGSLHFIQMDAADFESVKNAARKFLELEELDGRLDVLFNNAGVGARKNAPRTPQGHEHHFATNSIGHHLLTRLLAPILSRTAKKSPKDTVRVVWAASVLVDVISPQGGIRKEYLQDPFSIMNQNELYASSKAANWFLASEFARRQSETGAFGTGVVHIAANPGNYITGIWRTVPLLQIILRPILRYPIHGAYTYLWTAFSDSVTMGDAVTGRYAICDGRWHPGQRKDLLLALRGEEEGGSGRAREYFEWCEDKVKEFMG
ncbi:hypothetical protein F5Y00DRAFT_271474 [Daldinia vernicosa]|uniref:uncharacterized protein n=1 Tax=Daldinia vernicosa TaxID=114800 RepID=UPI0020082C3A|nr:uncharacterized protein F5Y00DRAFT_271474 [Daldinia vernicosa]KAI0847007.1 hypothetical protein F5Y00DRAFT_271474 [Daldinia vernicosa]